MRRHPPRWIDLSDEDRVYLEQLVRDGRTEQRVARRAKVLLAMADRTTIVQDLANQIGQTRMTIWNICRRYEEMGLDAVFDAQRSGRPRQISPPAKGASGATGVW